MPNTDIIDKILYFSDNVRSHYWRNVLINYVDKNYKIKNIFYYLFNTT